MCGYRAHHKSAKLGIIIGASLAVILIFVAIVTLVIRRFRKAQAKTLKSRFVIDEQTNTFSLTPFSTRTPAVPTSRAFVNNRKDGPRYRAPIEALDSTSNLTEGLDNPLQDAGPSKQNERRQQPSRNRISDVSLAPSYHTTIQRPS